jgi:hypothetical protein
VIPIEVDKDRNIITRTIVPLIWMPSLGPDGGANWQIRAQVQLMFPK